MGIYSGEQYVRMFEGGKFSIASPEFGEKIGMGGLRMFSRLRIYILIATGDL